MLLRSCRGLVCGVIVLVGVVAGPALNQARAQNPAPAPAAGARDPQAELQALLEQVGRLDPKAADYSARLRLILEGLIRANQELARENAALRQQLAARPAGGAGGSGAARPRGNGDPPKADPAATAPGALFGKRGLTKYHRVGCQFGDRINPADRVVFANPEAAKAAGYEACRVCRPDAPAPAAPPKP